MAMVIDTLDKWDDYVNGLMERTNRAHARPLKPLVQLLLTAVWAHRAEPISVRTLNGLPANMAWWKSKTTGQRYTTLHRGGDILILNPAHQVVLTLNDKTDLWTVPALIAAL